MGGTSPPPPPPPPPTGLSQRKQKEEEEEEEEEKQEEGRGKKIEKQEPSFAYWPGHIFICISPFSLSLSLSPRPTAPPPTLPFIEHLSSIIVIVVNIICNW